MVEQNHTDDDETDNEAITLVGDENICRVCGDHSSEDTHLDLEFEDQPTMRFPLCGDAKCAKIAALEIKQLTD